MTETASPEALYARFAPEASPWSPWVKPVIFTEVRDPPGDLAREVAKVDVAWAPDPMIERVVEDDAGYREAPVRERVATAERAALVVEVPGRRSALVGLALVGRGYRPVPLYNGVSGGRTGARATAIAEVLAGGAHLLEALPPDAPPAFLLDRDRMDGQPRPGDFDPRWLVFPQDFPSARALRARGVARVVVRSDVSKIADDLAHVLLEWQKAGLGLALSPDGDATVPLVVEPPSGFRSIFRRAAVLMGLRRSAAGGFGGMIPVPSQGGG